ncbi:MAG: hypothetical protein JXQ82_05960 [Methanomicrobiaceae archaeon]|nr:hypothetical protein [Methanomicrobiaceae archaeon]
MDEKKGHFENGRWVEDAPISDSETSGNKNDKSKGSEDKAGYDDIDRIIADTAGSVKNAVENVINLGSTVIGTEKGREGIEKKARKAGKKFLKQLENAIEDARKNL